VCLIRVVAIILCKMVNALPVLSITSGIYTMVVISIERVRCVLPARGQELTTPVSRTIGTRGTIIAFAVVWALSVVVATPSAVNFDVITANDSSSSSNHSLRICGSTWNALQTTIYSIFLLVVTYLLPQAVLYVNYGRLAAFLWRRRRAVAAASAQPQTASTGAGPPVRVQVHRKPVEVQVRRPRDTALLARQRRLLEAL